jgi:Spy/CpxP family protein refolding chaperone
MKSVLKTVLIAVTLGLAALPSSGLAQEKGPPPEGGGQRGPGGPRGRMTPEQQIARLEEAVGKLSDEQKTKITALYAKQAEKMREMREGQSGPPDEATRAKFDEAMKSARAEVRALLTPEQQTKFDAMPPPRGPGGRGPGGGGHKEGDAPKKTE